MTELIPVVNIPPQSHSSLEVFMTCPKQYYHKYVARDVKFQPSYASEWGDNAHKHLELYIKAGGNYTIPDERHKDTGQSMRDYQWVADALLNRAAQRGGYVLAERQFAVDRNHDTAGYWDKDAWLRGKIDVTIIYNGLGEAEVYDYKTGKKKSEVEQAMLYSASAMADYSNIHRVKAGYIWLKLPKEQMIDKPIVYTRNDLATMWQPFEQKYAALAEAYTSGVFPPKPNPLCRQWCDCPCQFNGRSIV